MKDWSIPTFFQDLTEVGSGELSISEGEIPELALPVPKVTVQWLVPQGRCPSWQLLPIPTRAREASLHLLGLRKATPAETSIIYFVASFFSSGKDPHSSTHPPHADNMSLLLDLTSGLQMHFSEHRKVWNCLYIVSEREKNKLKIVYSIQYHFKNKFKIKNS